MAHRRRSPRERSGAKPALPVALLLVAVLAVAACDRQTRVQRPAPEPVPNAVTDDIRAGIEKHIAEQVRAGGGYFRLEHEGRELRLKLVRVHIEYLANLGPRRHFACVDMADISGEFYDVDFFLSGDPGAMTVTETSVHKLNGVPYYFWKQKPDKSWKRVAIREATPDLLGIITGRDEFEFRYRVTLPEMKENAEIWIPLATTDDFQTVEIKSIDAPAEHRMLQEKEYGNRLLYLKLDPGHGGQNIEIEYHVVRLEKAAYEDGQTDLARYLEPDRLVPVGDQFRADADKVLEDKKGDLMRARALYDHVIDTIKYNKGGDGWGRGDAVYACDSRTGNCTDFHAYFIALARAAGIPARFAIGAGIPSQRDEGGVDGYHCWAEFHAEGKWWPIDVSEADKYAALNGYYFGHHPANRIEFSRGRDLTVEPGPASGPMNFLAYPVLEVAGNPARPKVAFFFKRIRGG
jgi:transglutaminase-like putative cysteine protease